MFSGIKKAFKDIKEDLPGKRFRRQYRRRKKARKSMGGKIALIGVGVMIIVGGIIMLPAPGPGMLIIFLGLGLIAQESLWLSIMLDKFELKLRSLYEWSLKKWRQAHNVAKVLAGLLLLAISAAFVYVMYWYLFIR